MTFSDDNVEQMREVREVMHKRRVGYEQACMIVGMFKLADAWNTRSPIAT